MLFIQCIAGRIAAETDLELGRTCRSGGSGRNRTGVDGFAGRCITTLLPSLGEWRDRWEPLLLMSKWLTALPNWRRCEASACAPSGELWTSCARLTTGARVAVGSAENCGEGAGDLVGHAERLAVVERAALRAEVQARARRIERGAGDLGLALPVHLQQRCSLTVDMVRLLGRLTTRC